MSTGEPEPVVEDLGLRDDKLIVYMSNGEAREIPLGYIEYVRRIGWNTGLLGAMLYAIIFLSLATIIYTVSIPRPSPRELSITYILLGSTVAMASIYMLVTHVVLPAEIKIVDRAGREHIYTIPPLLIPRAKAILRIVRKSREAG